MYMYTLVTCTCTPGMKENRLIARWEKECQPIGSCKMLYEMLSQLVGDDTCHRYISDTYMCTIVLWRARLKCLFFLERQIQLSFIERLEFPGFLDLDDDITADISQNNHIRADDTNIWSQLYYCCRNVLWAEGVFRYSNNWHQDSWYSGNHKWK